MKKDWLWDQDISEREIKEIFSDINDEKFISLSATLLSRKNSAKEIFTDYIKREDFFVCWQKIKKRMRKNSWNDPRIEYWQAIYETLKKEYPELVNLRQKKFEETLFPFYREKGKEIQEARKKLGLTQKEFAKKLGVSQQIISRVERGKQNLSYKTLEPICKQLGIPVDLEKKEKPDATTTRHRLPFSNLSGDEFERMCYWVIKNSSEFEHVEHYAGVGDKARDVIGYKYKVGKKETWYFQCKNYKKISPNNFNTELDKIRKHSEKDKDFKPDVIVFVTGCSVSANCKDKVKDYAKGNSFDSVYFWTDVELDEKAKSTGADKEFFNKGISSEDLKESTEDIKQHITISMQPVLAGFSEDSVRKDVINRGIDKTLKLIHKNELEKAKEELLKILGRIERNPDQYADELARTYNNLGICSIVSESEGGDLDKAEEYFNKALDIKPDFMKAKANLARVYFSRRGKNNFKKAYDIIRPLWEESDKKDSFVFLTFIWALHLHKSFKDAIEYYENSSEARLLTDQNEDLLNTMGNLYFAKGDFDKAEELVDQALTLSPHSPFSLSLKASIYLGHAQKENSFPSDVEVKPRFLDYRPIEKAKALFEQALEYAKEENRHYLENQIKHNINICLSLLDHVDGYYKINDNELTPEQRIQHLAQEFDVELINRNFESADIKLTKSLEWDCLSYEEKKRLAYIFFSKGAPEQAKNILVQLEEEANRKKDFLFWIAMSQVEVLLNEKNPAITAAKKAKNFAMGTNEEKGVLQHFNALMLRYASSGEVDRLMQGMFEYDFKYPKDKALRQVEAIDDSGKLTKEIKRIILEQKESYEKIRKIFKDYKVPTYHLEKIFKRPYAEILSDQHDPKFTFEFNFSNMQFAKELMDNFEKTQHLVFDYASLLNFSRMNLLGFLERSGKKLYIAKGLFDKIQSELLAFEQEDLRRLWRYLRSSKEIVIEKKSISVSDYKKLGDIFDRWIIESIKLANEKNAVFVTDDLRFMMFLRSKDISGCNSLIMLKVLSANEWIDPKVYSTSLGILAERFYTFIPFTGDDLFHIVMEDKSKITLRSYHLVNQLFLPGSVVSSFTKVFVRFLDLLWQTGSLPEDKVKWLDFLTSVIIDFIDNQGDGEDIKEIEKFAPDFVDMWIVATQRSNRDETILLEKETNKILDKPYFTTFKDNVTSFIQNKRKSFNPR